MRDFETFYKMYVREFRAWLKELDVNKTPTVKEMVARETVDTMARDYYILTGRAIHMTMDYDNYIFKIYEGDNAKNTRVVYQEGI